MMLEDEDLWSADTIWILTMQFLGCVRTRGGCFEAVAQLEHVHLEDSTHQLSGRTRMGIPTWRRSEKSISMYLRDSF